MIRRTSKIAPMLGLSLIVSLLAAEAADARRGGSFGSRGGRTYSAPPPTRTAPRETAPIQRSMTEPSKARTPAAAPAAAGAQAQAPGRRGMFGGMGAGLLGGLVAGGLIGALLGHGFGGFGAGMMNTLLQVALIGGAIWLLMALFRRRRPTPAAAGFGAGFNRETFANGPTPTGANRGFEAFGAVPRTPEPVADEVDIGLVQSDRDAFERLLSEVQDAFGREDYGALRQRTTPEIMSYLSEELSQNATQGRRNEVSGTRLLEADVAEAWREGDTEYATAAMRYESIDVMRDRQTGAVVEGDDRRPTETTELWTFVRRGGEPWKLSAIQEA